MNSYFYKFLLTINYLILATNAYAQNLSQCGSIKNDDQRAICRAQSEKSSTPWKYPTNIVELCRNIEVSIVSAFKSEIDANRVAVNNKLSSAERAEASALSDAAKIFQRVEEDRWHKINCTHLLYKK